jgi:hypothetical protein
MILTKIAKNRSSFDKFQPSCSKFRKVSRDSDASRQAKSAKTANSQGLAALAVLAALAFLNPHKEDLIPAMPQPVA